MGWLTKTEIYSLIALKDRNLKLRCFRAMFPLKGLGKILRMNLNFFVVLVVMV